MSSFLDLSGQKFGKWLVLERNGHDLTGGVLWLCQCECGTLATVYVAKIKNRKNPGCFKCGWTTHGMTHTPEYGIWCAMKDRCLRLSNKSYLDYGGRGIQIQPEWIHDFMAFYNHLGPRPSKEMRLDRIDNDGNYEPGNIRWATVSESNLNRRKFGRVT
jgi:hypothetical protein